MTLAIIVNNQSERGPLESVVAKCPRAIILGKEFGGAPDAVMSDLIPLFTDEYIRRGVTRVLIVGDRYESLSAALAAMFLQIPVAHIHGGEKTTGAFDDAIRHSITHIADLHFVAHEKFGARVAELRGSLENIHVVGAPGLDGVECGVAQRSEKLILAAFHPETRAKDYGVEACRAMCEALESKTDHFVSFTNVNNDPGSDDIIAVIIGFMERNKKWAWASMDHKSYVALMGRAQLVIGNSSAGIIEAPWVGTPSVNIGKRQDGRLRALSVFQWPDGELASKIQLALDFRGYANPHYVAGASEKIVKILGF